MQNKKLTKPTKPVKERLQIKRDFPASLAEQQPAIKLAEQRSANALTNSFPEILYVYPGTENNNTYDAYTEIEGADADNDVAIYELKSVRSVTIEHRAVLKDVHNRLDNIVIDGVKVD